MKNTLKLTLMMALFAGSLFADGQIGTGGRNCPPEGCPPPCTENCGRPSPAEDPVKDLTVKMVRGITRFYFLGF